MVSKLYSDLYSFCRKNKYPIIKKIGIYSFAKHLMKNKKMDELFILYSKGKSERVFMNMMLYSYETILKDVAKFIKDESQRQYTLEDDSLKNKIEKIAESVGNSELYKTIYELRNNVAHYNKITNVGLNCYANDKIETELNMLLIYSVIYYYYKELEIISPGYWDNWEGIRTFGLSVRINTVKNFRSLKLGVLVPFSLIWGLLLGILKAIRYLLGETIPRVIIFFVMIFILAFIGGIRNLFDYDQDFVRMDSSKLVKAITDMTPVQQSYYIKERLDLLNDLGYTYRVGDKKQGEIDCVTYNLYEYSKDILPDVNSNFYGKLIRNSRNIIGFMNKYNIPGRGLFEFPGNQSYMLSKVVNQDKLPVYANYPELEDNYYLMIIIPRNSMITIRSHISDLKNLSRVVAKYPQIKVLLKIGIPNKETSKEVTQYGIKRELSSLMQKEGVKSSQIRVEYDSLQESLANIYIKNLPAIFE